MEVLTPSRVAVRAKSVKVIELKLSKHIIYNSIKISKDVNLDRCWQNAASPPHLSSKQECKLKELAKYGGKIPNSLNSEISTNGMFV